MSPPSLFAWNAISSKPWDSCSRVQGAGAVGSIRSFVEGVPVSWYRAICVRGICQVLLSGWPCCCMWFCGLLEISKDRCRGDQTRIVTMDAGTRHLNQEVRIHLDLISSQRIITARRGIKGLPDAEHALCRQLRVARRNVAIGRFVEQSNEVLRCL